MRTGSFGDGDQRIVLENAFCVEARRRTVSTLAGVVDPSLRRAHRNPASPRSHRRSR